MRIALVISQYPPAVGGSEIATQRTARVLAGRGHEVVVITLARDDMPEDERDGEHLRIRRAVRPVAIGPIWGITYMRGVERELRAHGPFDVIHCRQAYLHSIAAARVARKTGAGLVSTICNSGALLDFRTLGELRLGERMLAEAAKPPAMFIALSRRVEEESAAFLAERGISAPIERVPNFVDTERFSPAAAMEYPPIAIYVGRLEPQKNLGALLEAFAIAAAANAEARLRIVGTGSEDAALRAHAESLGISSRVEFVGHRDDVVPPLRESGFAVSATHSEGMSNALLEQAACGLGAAVADVSGVRDVLGEPTDAQEFGSEVTRLECGFAAPVGNTRALSHAMALMFGSVELRRQLGEKSRIRATSHFSPDAVVSHLEAVYARAAAIARKEPTA